MQHFWKNFASNKKGAKGKKAPKAGGGQGFGNTSTDTTSTAQTAKNKPKVTKARRQQERSQEDGTAETALLTKIYTEQFHQQQERKPVPRELVQVSHSPLMFTIDDFIDPEACTRVQSNGAGCFDLHFPELVSDLLFNGQETVTD